MHHNWYHEDGWHHREDPYGVVPVGYWCKNLMGRVLGFCSPAGKAKKHLMVVITRTSNTGVECFTTAAYLTVLADYLKNRKETK